MSFKPLLLLLLVSVFSTETYAQDFITVYKDCDYRGDSHRLYAGEFLDRDLGVGNDQISSIRIPPGFRVTAYSDNNFRGSSLTWDEDVSCMPSNWNDKISSIRVERVNNRYNRYNNSSGGNTVTLYADCEFRGASETYREGTYYDRDLRNIGNDKLSSIRVPRGMSITIYTDNNQRGSSATYTDDVNCLPLGLNDRVSSFVISRADSRNYNRSSRSGNIQLFEDCDYRGNNTRIGEGYYGANDFGPVRSDKLSSVRVPNGYEVILYEHDNRGGRSIILTDDEACLPSDFNDIVSSIVVRRRR